MAEEIKKHLSQEEKRFANMAKRFIRQSGIAVKNFRMFGEKHPVLINSVRNITEILKILFSGKESVTFTFLEGALLVEELPLKDMDPKVYSLITDLKECSITSLSFSPEIAESDLKVLLKILSSGSSYIKDEGGIINILERQNISSIKVDEMYFKRISKQEEEAQSAKNQLADMLIVDFLTGKKAISKDDIGLLTGEIDANPDRIGKIVSKAALSKTTNKPMGKAGEGSKLDEGAVDFACSSIEKLADHIKKSGKKNEKEVKQDLSNLMLALDPSLRSTILKSSSGKYEPIVKNAISAFSDEIIINIIVADFVDNNASIVEARKLIRRLLPKKEKRDKVFPILEKKLLAKGISQEKCSALIEGNFWDDMTIEERVESIQKNDPIYCIDIGISLEIKALIDNLLLDKKTSLISLIIDKVLDNFKSKDADLKIRLVRDMGRIVPILFQSEVYKNKSGLLKRLSEEYTKNENEELKKRFIELITSLIKTSIEKKDYESIPLLISITGYKEIKHSIFKDEKELIKFLESLISGEKAKAALLIDITKAIGEDACKALCEIMCSYCEDDFESYRTRHTISLILKELKDVSEDLLIDRLSNNKIEVIITSLEALNEIGSKKSVPSVEKLIEHKNEKIKNHAKIALTKINKRS